MFVEISTNLKDSLPIVLLTVGHTANQPKTDRPIGMSCCQILWCTDGNGIYEVGGKTFPLEKGKGVFTRNAVPHRYEGVNLSTSWVTFLIDPGFLDYFKVGDYLYFDSPQFLEEERISLDRQCRGYSTPVSRSALVYAFICEFFTAVMSSQECVEDKVRRYLENHYSEPITLDMIAEHVGMNRFSLCHYFSESCGVSVMTELTRIRIEKAKGLLRYSDYQIEVIGKACGFESQSYFSKRFREYCECSPSEYRIAKRQLLFEKSLFVEKKDKI